MAGQTLIPRTPCRVTHVITTLQVGGAERMLQRLVEASDSNHFQHSVIGLSGAGPVGDALLATGRDVVALDVSGRSLATGFAALVGTLRQQRADVVVTWMVHANFLGGLAARRVAIPRTVWTLHHSDRPGGRRRTLLLERVNARLSAYLADAVVCSAKATSKRAVAIGYPRERLQVIRNGVPDLASPPRARQQLRAELGLAPDTPLVGLVARRDPQKDLQTFLVAAELLCSWLPEVNIVLCGRGMERNALTVPGRLACRLHWLGERADPEVVIAGLDVLVSSSAYGETFPLVLGEALALEIPVVATDVGDSRLLSDLAGRTVPPRSPKALAAAVMDLLGLPAADRVALGRRGRSAVLARFGLPVAVAAYEEVIKGSA